SVFFIKKAGQYLEKKESKAFIIILSLPIALTLWADVDGFMLGGIYRMPLDAVDEVNNFINQNTRPSDLVVSFSYFKPYLKPEMTVFVQVMGYYGHEIVPYMRGASMGDFAYNQSIENVRYMVLPEGLLDSLNDSEYDVPVSDLREWPAVLQVHRVQARGPGLPSLLLEYLGIPAVLEHDYVILENPL
ncbi:MAG: hypothetical protein ABIH11_06005, partial [Candidatus Altiarchaeota archaeon]